MQVLIYILGFVFGLLLLRRPDCVVPLVRVVAVLSAVGSLVYVGKCFFDWLFGRDYQ